MATRNAGTPPDAPPQRQRKGAHPLFWLLILLALLALGWSYYIHRAGESTPAPIRTETSPASAPPANG
jgi:hypothetical protein